MDWENLCALKEGDALALKGFLYQANSGEWILSSEPHLKSCCIGSQDKQHIQVHLVGDYSTYSTNQPMTVQGDLRISPEGRFQLVNIKATQSDGFPFWTAGAFLLCLVFAGVKLKRLLLP